MKKLIAFSCFSIAIVGCYSFSQPSGTYHFTTQPPPETNAALVDLPSAINHLAERSYVQGYAQGFLEGWMACRASNCVTLKLVNLPYAIQVESNVCPPSIDKIFKRGTQEWRMEIEVPSMSHK